MMTGDRVTPPQPQKMFSLQNLIVKIPSTETGDLLGAMAEKVAHRRATKGNEYAAVKESLLSTMGVVLAGTQPFEAFAQLMANPEFIYYPELKHGFDLVSLPAGAIVVWGTGQAAGGGHISIALGDGNEASDHIIPQTTSLEGIHNF